MNVDRSEPTIPSELLRQWEDGNWLGTCDWGRCDGETVGWAQCDCDDEWCSKGYWLAICAECLERGRSRPETTGEDHPVARSITFKQIEERYAA